ncbi:hypothetical protein ACFX1Z_041414 [Malus domestica]
MASPSASSSPIESVPPPNPNSSNPNSSSPNLNSSQMYNSLTIQNIGSMVPIKLRRSNYLPWRALFAPILRRYKLLGIVDGTEPCPSPFLPDRSLNPAFEQWYEKDQNLLIWFNSTLSEEIIPFTVGVSSARDLWLKLEHRFGGVSDAHIHQLRSKLQNIQKGSQSMSDYLQQIKEISDSLNAAGVSLTDRDLIAATLAGLSDDFESFTDSILLRLSSTSLDELHGMLLTKELSMERRKKISSSEPFHAFSVQGQPPLLPTPSQALAAQTLGASPLQNSFRYNSNRNYNRGSNRGYTRGSNRGSNRGFNRSNSNSGFSRGSYNSRFNRHASPSGHKTPYQICGSTSHEALDCFDRMNPEISGKFPPAKLAAMCAHYTAKSSNSWLIDSGATSHITNDISNIQSPTPYHGEDKVYIGDGKGLSIAHTGTSTLHTHTSSFQLHNVLHVPHMKHSLLSAYQFIKDNDCSLTLDIHGSSVKDRFTGMTLLRGSVRGGFFPLQGSSSSNAPTSPTALVSSSTNVRIWHSRLGHPSSVIFRKVLSTNKVAVQGRSSPDFFCKDCALAKNHKLPFGTTPSASSTSLELLHCDVWGPSPVVSVSGYRYYLLIVDDYSKYSWYFPLKSKSSVFSTFVEFKSYVENTIGNKIKVVRSDSGGEFTSHQFQHFLKLHGILQQFSCPHTPEQNGCVERKHRHLVETARTLLVQSQVPHMFWVEAFSTAIYLINRLPLGGLLQSPWELLFFTSPDYSRLRVFGCGCYTWLKPYTTSKLDSKSKSCVFLGYSLQHKGYRCLDPLTQRVYISRHVLFDETTFPFHTLSSATVLPPHSFADTSQVNPYVNLQFPISAPSSPASLSSSPAPLSSSPAPLINPSSTHSPVPPLPSPVHPYSVSLSPLSPPPTNIHPMLTRSKAGISKPKAYSATNHHLPDTVDVIPSTYLQASKHAHWRSAIQDEYNALQSTGTWSLVPFQSHQNIVGCKWVFRVKKHPDGTIDRYKARLVAKGFHQQAGLDYKETFSPVAKPITIRILLSLAVQHDWFLNQLDISNAFLHGDLQEDVYMQQPPGFSDPNYPHHVYKLRKSLYGLKQAHRAWFDKLFVVLKSLGFHQSQSDASLFVIQTPVPIFVLVYVDDILVTGPNPTACHSFIQKLSTIFPVKDLGPLHYFLGLEVQRSSAGLFLHQSKYILDLLHKTNMAGAKPCLTPLGSVPLDHTGSLLPDPHEYRSIVGALQYLTWTRPDLSFAVNQVCQFMHAPREPHLQAAKRILRFLKATVSHGLWFKKGDIHLTAYSDADWAGCPFDRRSTSGYCIFLGSNLISWSAKKQPTVARSSTEAEYRSLAYTAAEITWICKVFKDLGFHLPHVPSLWCDNLSAISLASNPVFHARTKHIELDYHYIRELVLANLLKVQYVCSQDQLADIHTKSLSKSRFLYLQSKLSLGPFDASKFSLRGCKGSSKIS